MAKFELRNQARGLRRQGVSVKTIAEILRVSKGSVSVWVRDIILTVEQLELLRKSSIKGAELGRLRSALLQKQRWKDKMEKEKQEGRSFLGILSDREILLVGVALYWGEGSKKKREIQFCNSDPVLIRFLLLWLYRCFSVNRNELKCCVGINEIHREREDKVKQYWSLVTEIPLEQFRKTSFKKTLNKKVYDNFEDHYGTLSVSVKNPSRFYAKILGLIDAFQYNLPG